MSHKVQSIVGVFGHVAIRVRLGHQVPVAIVSVDGGGAQSVGLLGVLSSALIVFLSLLDKTYLIIIMHDDKMDR